MPPRRSLAIEDNVRVERGRASDSGTARSRRRSATPPRRILTKRAPIEIAAPTPPSKSRRAKVIEESEPDEDEADADESAPDEDEDDADEKMQRPTQRRMTFAHSAATRSCPTTSDIDIASGIMNVAWHASPRTGSSGANRRLYEFDLITVRSTLGNQWEPIVRIDLLLIFQSLLNTETISILYYGA